MKAIHGCDVSGWQRPKNCNWFEAYIDGCRFAYVKASQKLKPMGSFAEHWRRLRDSGIVQGAYHFADMRWSGKHNPEEQAALFVDTIGEIVPGDLPPALDLEWQSYRPKSLRSADIGKNARKFPAARVVDWALRFCTRVEELTDTRPVIYTGRSFIRYRLHKSAVMSRYPLWLAAYVDVGSDRAYTPETHEGPRPVQMREQSCWPVRIWQFTGRGSVQWYRGGKGKIDRNLWLGTAEEFDAFRVGV